MASLLPFRLTRMLPLYRAGIVLAAAILLHSQARWLEDQKAVVITLRQAGRYFPQAHRLQVRDEKQGLVLVLDALGETIGGLLMTSPWTDGVIGYSGPNNLLIALDPRGAVVGVEWLSSGDTREHVAMVRTEPGFLEKYLGWKSGESPPPPSIPVSGATLTSQAVAEGVQQRLLGSAPSLRFPEPIMLEEIQSLFPRAAQFTSETSMMRVLDGTGQLLGFALRTSPQADNVAGYRGPTECLIALAPDGWTVTQVRVRKSYDTGSYVEQVEKANAFFELFPQRTVEDLSALEYPKQAIDGISGATRTARAVVEGVQRRMAAELESRKPTPGWRPQARDLILAGVILGALLMAFTHLRGYRWVRIGWQLVVIGYVGLISHDLLSLAIFSGWSAHGLAWQAAPGLVLLAISALVFPWGTRRQLYCHHVCPHGAAQQLLGRLTRRRLAIPHRLLQVLEWIPGLLLACALLAVLAGTRVNLAAWEPFDAWTWGRVGTATIVIAIAGLVASLFVPLAYCRFGCPTGAIFSFLRSSGSVDHWGRRDGAGLALIMAGLLVVGGVRNWPRAEPEPEPSVLRGRTMGTTWSLKIHDELASPNLLEQAVAKEFDWAEGLTSHWRTNTDLAEFNRTQTTEPMPVPWPVLTLGRWSAEISQATEGAFDITLGPLVGLWGFGPNSTPRTEPPTDAEIDALLPAVGWGKLELLDGMLKKSDSRMAVDLSAIAKGWAIDKVTDLLDFRGYTNFLVEAGGEWRARGRWKVGVDHPDREIVLWDEALGTSGTYRKLFESGGRRYAHLIDPRTGRPVTHRTVAVCVRHAETSRADAWATALNVLGVEQGMPLAERLSLAAQFVVEKSDGKVEIIASGAWKKREQEVSVSVGKKLE